MQHIAFIGLGNMGGPMAANLVNANMTVTVFDLVDSAMEKAVGVGAKAASSAQQAVVDADVVISMLPAAEHVLQLYMGENGLLKHLPQGTLVIDSSTIDADTAKSVGEAITKRGCQFVDAPVSGGVAGAKAGTLTFIMGGDIDAVANATPVLQCMGKNLFHAGPVGAGQIAKICNNMLLAVLMAGTSEALQMAVDNGLDAKVMSDIMLQSSGCNWTLQKYNPCPGVMDDVPSSHEYQGGFMTKLMNKDLSLAMATAAGSMSATPIASAAQGVYRQHLRRGQGEKDFSSIFEWYR